MELLSKFGDKNSSFLLIGKIVKAHGLRGAVKIRSFSDSPERFFDLDTVYLTPEAEDLPQGPVREIDGVQQHSPQFIICYFSGVEDRNQAEALVGQHVHMLRSEAEELPEDTFYIVDLIGFKTYSETQVYLGEVVDIIQGPQDLLEIQTPEGQKHWIPFVKALVPEVDFVKKTMTIHLIEGLLEL